MKTPPRSGSLEQRIARTVAPEVMTDRVLMAATKYWANHLGCSPEALFSQPMNVITHGPALADYDGIFAIFRDEAATVSLPQKRAEHLRKLLPSPPIAAEELAGAFEESRFIVIGPASIAYASKISSPSQAARLVTTDDAKAIELLKASCCDTEWEHGGSTVGDNPCSGMFVDGQLVSLAGYCVWGSVIAHISVITHPDYRRRNYGRHTVSHIANAALEAGLVPQYRTLTANVPSIRIAETLGFCHFASSVAVRVSPAD